MICLHVSRHNGHLLNNHDEQGYDSDSKKSEVSRIQVQHQLSTQRGWGNFKSRFATVWIWIQSIALGHCVFNCYFLSKDINPAKTTRIFFDVRIAIQIILTDDTFWQINSGIVIKFHLEKGLDGFSVLFRWIFIEFNFAKFSVNFDDNSAKS